MSFLGIDLGTGGVRCVVANVDGFIETEFQVPFKRTNLSEINGHSEQDPNDWIRSLQICLDRIFTKSKASNHEIKAIAVDGTSGTVLPVNPDGDPLGHALMHNDMRAIEQCDECEAVFGGPCSPTFALPKILWMVEQNKFSEDTLFFHATDFIYSWLAGTTEILTDFTSAMKTGVDLESEDWPNFEIFSSLNLPPVTIPGKRFGYLSQKLRTRWGVVNPVLLVSGATDSNAAFYASGACNAGDWASTIGTTLALKGISKNKCTDPKGRIYCHKHPDGMWLPGGASNAGGEIIREKFSGREQLMETRLLSRRTFGSGILYPSVRVGERLPVVNENFQPFSTVCQEQGDELFYMACLEGIAYTEKLIFEILEKIEADTTGLLYAMGGMARSKLGLQIRADLLGKTIKIPCNPNSAFGAAILAASGYHESSVASTSSNMVRIDREVEPRSEPATHYHDKYLEFRSLCFDQN